ncbi:hypothetical protein AMAG_18678 [Allomyces macrogynus ATCC 38327]|uniref:Uncharacterized protein n=1 Tax=Allomyces macrogynus (strain ATCC 38327) TaxID=578462 RepID=A0A0L0SGZ2_ALLM3|nr:hypothetical protein AMAG_18678 [Allomyces macrogynus ATCC 38327]|eukprot:KNE61719.1 hypothetical protein AMAG_18678 [Allomyces macrogynus ATCC 38327]
MSMTASTIPGLFGPVATPAPDQRAQYAAAAPAPDPRAQYPAAAVPTPRNPNFFESPPTAPTTTAAPDLGLPSGTEPSALTFDLGARLVHLFFDVVRFGIHAVATVTRFMVSNPITRPIAWLWLEVIKQLASLALGASRGLVEVVIDMMQPKIALPAAET